MYRAKKRSEGDWARNGKVFSGSGKKAKELKNEIVAPAGIARRLRASKSLEKRDSNYSGQTKAPIRFLLERKTAPSFKQRGQGGGGKTVSGRKESHEEGGIEEVTQRNEDGGTARNRKGTGGRKRESIFLRL